jgi:hypothetical protein
MVRPTYPEAQLREAATQMVGHQHPRAAQLKISNGCRPRRNRGFKRSATKTSARAWRIQERLQCAAILWVIWSWYARLLAEPNAREGYRRFSLYARYLQEFWNSTAGVAARFALIACMMPAVCGVAMFLYFQRLNARPIDNTPKSIVVFRWPATPLPLYRSLDEVKKRASISRL